MSAVERRSTECMKLRACQHFAVVLPDHLTTRLAGENSETQLYPNDLLDYMILLSSSYCSLEGCLFIVFIYPGIPKVHSKSRIQLRALGHGKSAISPCTAVVAATSVAVRLITVICIDAPTTLKMRLALTSRHPAI